WYRFLGSVRATLGTESGSNIFDTDGTLRRRIEACQRSDPTVAYEQVHDDILAPREGEIRMNQISPKVFEAIRLRTALIMFEGTYSGVIEPHRHYIPLAKVMSNIDSIFEKLEDVDFLAALTDRAYEDIIGSEKYSYRTFVHDVDREIACTRLRGSAYRIYSV